MFCTSQAHTPKNFLCFTTQNPPPTTRNAQHTPYATRFSFQPHVVRLIGLEPTRIATPDPKSGASTNFATSAIVFANAVQR